jgi:catechol 2,3-dioxygenase-like lactoylglutathione lyase family enzyme
LGRTKTLKLPRLSVSVRGIMIDHTIVPSKDKKTSAVFYARIFGFEDMGERPKAVLHPVRVNDSTILFFENSSDLDSPWAKGIHHIAFHFDRKQFLEVFTRIKKEGIPYGDNYAEPANMKEPGMAPGARGNGKSVYFKDPSGNLLQIITY